jgi:hypothetical protein
MMNMTGAAEFLQRWATHFTNEEVRNWVWSADDDVFGKRTSWQVGEAQAMESIASVELMEDHIQLTVTERDVATSSEDVSGADAQVVFDAVVDFEECSVLINGEPLIWGDSAIAEALRRFGERA